MLGLKEIYFPMFDEIFSQYNIPSSMKYLAVIESALNPHAISRAGAVGMWQFIYPTGKLYDLDVDPFIDERRDPYKATEAAARHMRDLYEFYHDWLLVLAAYNCGAHNVNKAINRSGGKTDYWEIMRYLPRETRGYVPAFIAAAYTMNFYSYHGIVPEPPLVCFDSTCFVLVERPMHFAPVAKYLGLSNEELSHLNPELKRGFVPQVATPYWLNLPENKIALFEQNMDSIFSESAKIPLTEKDWYAFNLTNKTELIYTVKHGDNLGFIADWFDCHLQDIRLWNEIYRNRIKPGQKLRIYVPKEKAEKYKKINQMSFAQKQKFSGKSVQRITALSNSNSTPVSDGKFIYHTIKNGDTLWDIAKLYPNVTIEHLKKINNIGNSKRLKPGMVIKVQAVG